ncbi:hypothetical protein RT95_19835 [Xanthomonas campestris]|nr:hypothetical protein RT95_19835 [Xanthomonas campestris]
MSGARGALTACGTRRESVHGGSVAACMPPHGPASGEDTAPEVGRRPMKSCLFFEITSELELAPKCRNSASRIALDLQTDNLEWSLPAHRCGTLCGMDAA